jgi:hypothetical protein
MVSQIGPAIAPVTEPAHGSQPVTLKVQDASGNNVPPSRQTIAAGTAAAAPDAQALTALLNKFSNQSGLPTQYRVAPQSGNRLIQEINPANGDVLGEFSVDEFPALAASLGITSALVDYHA